MSVRRHSPTDQEVDLEATAELPMIDFSAPADDETQVLTDNFAIPVFPAGVSELADSLRDVESRLQRKGERVKQLESQLAATEARERDLRAEQDRERTAARQRDTDSARLLSETEQTLASLRADLAAREAALLSTQQALETERTMLAAAKAQQDRERTAAQQRETDTARQITETAQALTTVRADLAAREAALLSTQQALDSERQLLTAARREVETRATAFQHQTSDLAATRGRSERQLEALQNAQALLGVREAMLGERDAELMGIEARHAAVVAELEARNRALQAELVSRTAALQSDLDSSRTASQTEIEVRTSALQEEMATKVAAKQAELDEAQSRADTAAADLGAQKALLESAVHQSLELATQLEASRAQLAKQEAELSELRSTAEEARLGAAAYEEQGLKIEELQSALHSSRSAANRFEQDLRVAEEQIQRLESDAHASAAMLGNLQQNIARLGREDTGTRPALTAAQAPALKVVGVELPTRYLIREEGGAEIQHPVTRRTTVGRTPDNDIQIDTTFVSRHHAVVLSSSQHCVVEDLNSTNGVMVNGRRINRHILHDGDEVIIGNTVFRYHQPA